MSTPTPLAAWLGSRTPPPPAALTERVTAMTAEHGGAAPVESLLASAEAAMAALLHDGCLTRGSALDLLAVDALVTYAFEAAADEPQLLDDRARRVLATIAALAEPYRA